MAFSELPEAGALTLTTPFSWNDRMNLPRAERRVLSDDQTPLGRAALTVVNRPTEVTWWLEGAPCATIVATRDGVDEGLVPVKYATVPVTLGDWRGELSLVAEGSRLRLAGRRRYLLVAGGELSWTYHHVGADGRDGAGGVRRLTGDPAGERLLQRGEHPGKGSPMVSVRREFPEGGAAGSETYRLGWQPGCAVEEIALAWMLLLTVNENELAPFLVRASFSLGGNA